MHVHIKVIFNLNSYVYTSRVESHIYSNLLIKLSHKPGQQSKGFKMLIFIDLEGSIDKVPS